MCHIVVSVYGDRSFSKKYILKVTFSPVYLLPCLHKFDIFLFSIDGIFDKQNLKKNMIFSSQLNECQTKCRYTIMFCQMIYDFFVCAASVYYGKALVLNNPYDSNLDVSFLREMLNFVWGRHKNITRCLCIWQRLSMERG